MFTNIRGNAFDKDFILCFLSSFIRCKYIYFFYHLPPVYLRLVSLNVDVPLVYFASIMHRLQTKVYTISNVPNLFVENHTLKFPDSVAITQMKQFYFVRLQNVRGVWYELIKNRYNNLTDGVSLFNLSMEFHNKPSSLSGSLHANRIRLNTYGLSI